MRIRLKKAFLFDWGNTIMRDFPDEQGAMHSWRRVEAMPNAEKMLRKLVQIADCYLATNARDSDKENIVRALQRVHLHSYFKDIFCYREIGFPKPSFEYFDTIRKKLAIEKEDMVMIGDDLESDVTGAIHYGIEAILYDYQDARNEYQGTRITDLISVTDLYGQENGRNAEG